MPKKRVVWILGAGFSRPLGGPLLRDMLTRASQDRIGAAYREGEGDSSPYRALFDRTAESVRSLYFSFGPSATLGRGHWEHAEEFLEALDAGAYAVRNGRADSPSAALLPRLGRFKADELTALSQTARRLMAAECCSFLKDTDPDFEKWQPYRKWAGHLGIDNDDTVITFNYDTVLETAARAESVLDNRISVVLPLPGTPNREHEKVLVLKLHGSVDWQRYNDPVLGSCVRRLDQQADFAVSGPVDEILVASPGPNKHHAVKVPLAKLWSIAVDRLKAADALVFVGYRFPPSDATARGTLLDAVAANRDVQRLVVHTVLGPDTRSDNSLRLAGMLDHAMRGAGRRREGNLPPRSPLEKTYEIIAHAMGAEDFLGLHVPGRLCGMP